MYFNNFDNYLILMEKYIKFMSKIQPVIGFSFEVDFIVLIHNLKFTFYLYLLYFKNMYHVQFLENIVNKK